jgi:hypothetical protein
MSSSSQSYTLGGSMATIDLGPYSMSDTYTKKFPNQKINISVHGANGGYIMEIATQPGQVGELFIIPDGQDLGQEIGKIITHKMLKENHE